ncbi:MAG: late competence development ComFB family protein [Treponema sp.]|nr:late competence development ComFB family protein [Treponema sp.]
MASFVDRYDFHLLKNEAEQLVIQELERQLATHDDDFCRCNECILDMAAMAFNVVRPMYRFSLMGALYAAQAMDDQDYAENVKQAVAQAIDKVKSNPSHD